MLRTLIYVSFVLMSIIIPMRGLLSLLSLCLKKIFCLPPTPSACSHSPYIFHAENTEGEKVTMCVLLLRHKNIRTCFFACRVVYFCSSARRDRGAVTQVTEGLIDIPTFGGILQPPRLAATPPIFSVRKIQREKRLPCVI